MSLTEESSLRDVALVVGAALHRHRVGAVLTGGACASIHSDGAYSSLDVDFILTTGVTQSKLDEAMAEAGFRRSGDRYVHPHTPFWVEFPRGPLAVGGDYTIRPTLLRGPTGRARALSPTDSCRDRLAGFYHWNDRQSLEAAVQIAQRRRLKLALIRKWSHQEGNAEQFNEFLQRVRGQRGRTS